MKILFLIQRSKVNKRGLVPIMCRLTHLKQRKEFSTGLMIRPEEWSGNKRRLKESASNKGINSELEIIHQKIHKAYLLLQVRELPFTLEDVLKEFRGETLKIDLGVIEVYNEHNDYYKKLVGKDIKEVSWQKFENTKSHLKEFIRWKFNQRDFKLNKLKFQFIKEFEYYLRTEKDMQQSTINKTLQRFKKLVNFAVAHEYLDRNPFLMHKPKQVKKEVVYLKIEELKHLQEKEIKNKRIEEVRDCFVFCCYTGLAFNEMSNLNSGHIVKGEDGRNWIKMYRQKTNKSLSIPILPTAQNILNKYLGKLDNDKVLPSKTNAHFNAYLKEIADLCEIKINLTHHIARKTFATTVLLLNDVPMEIVSKLLGHSRIGITQAHYGQIVEKKVGEQMDRVAKKLTK
ncbi:site-specific integrase [Gramella sp. BOM4]|nr:site-specific integrase [Christiangramia bathymodioli]